MNLRHPAIVVLASALLAAQQPQVIPAGYHVETIALPTGVAFGVGGLDFAGDGTLFVSTREGQVWTYAGGHWHLFAEGLHEPLGISVDRQTRQVFVVQRPELTELIDADGDGRAETFRTVCAAWGLTDNYHEYAYGLVRDAQGWFYGTLNTTLSFPDWAGSEKWNLGRVHEGKMGRAAAHRGWSFRVSPDGRFEPWSVGMRSPCGIGIRGDGELFYTDNQGDWVAVCGLHVMRKGRFHGHPSSLADDPDYAGVDLNAIPVAEYDRRRSPPAVYFPYGDLSNSAGEPVFDETGGKFGPFTGQAFIGDQTRSNVFRVALEEVAGDYQGCVVDFVDHLQSGVVRSRFAADGSLWVGETGRGWGSRGEAKYGLQRIVWDGVTVPFAIHSVSLLRTGFEVRFTLPVDAARAAQREAWTVRRWRYEYRPEYGSPKIDEIEVPLEAIAVTVAADARSVRLELPLQAGWVYELTVDVDGAGGEPLCNRVAWYTLNRLRD